MRAQAWRWSGQYRRPLRPPVAGVVPPVKDAPEMPAMAKGTGSRECPACERRKDAGYFVCGFCYMALPAAMKGRIWREAEFLAAVAWLKKHHAETREFVERCHARRLAAGNPLRELGARGGVPFCPER